jgi:BirA family biotin operon repressor/biotin-[acetyl-CoA-carboxylase] ligase
VALAVATAAEAVAGVAPGTIRLKWPNDLVALDAATADEPLRIRKVAGLLGETEGLGTADPRAIVGIGTNVDWAADAFPTALAPSMTSLREVAGRPVDRDAVLERALAELEGGHAALLAGRFDARGWIDRQVTTGLVVRLEGPGEAVAIARAEGVDADSGALIVADLEGPLAGIRRAVHAGEVTHLRIPSAVAV